MEHVRVATYGIINGTFREVADAAQTGMLHKFQSQPGFVRYGVADVGDKTCVSISFWNTREQADGASLVAASWVRENLDRAAVELRWGPRFLGGDSGEGLIRSAEVNARRGVHGSGLLFSFPRVFPRSGSPRAS